MSAFAYLLLWALLGAMCSGSIVRRESPPEPQYNPCYINQTWYAHGDSTGDLCGRCGCLDGRQRCSKRACYDAEGNEVPIPAK